MRAVDVFGLAVAALLGLLTMIVQAWSPEWWVLVALAATIALASFAHILGRKNLSANRPWILIVGGPILGLIWLYLLNRPQAIEPIDGNIFVSCQLSFLPEVMPPDGRLEVIALSPDALLHTAGKVPVQGRSGAPGSKINWPEVRIGNVPSGWRCEITNDTPSALLDVKVPVKIKYGNEGEEREGIYDLVSIRLDPGPTNRRVI